MEFLILLLAAWLLIVTVVGLQAIGEAKRRTANLEMEFRKLAESHRKLSESLQPQAPAAPLPENQPPAARIPALSAAKSPPALPAEKPPAPTFELPAWTNAPGPPPPPRPPKEPFSLEHFMGVRLFAWLGGLAMFFGVVLFVKYAFENNLIPPAVRIALGFLIGAVLLGAGMFVHRLPRYRVLAQAFCATGVVTLYGVTYAAHAVYRFPAFGTGTSFVLMALVTLGAFLLAVRLEALVVAVLGMLGGFFTPILLSTGVDQPLALFGYIALLDVGLLAVSRFHGWKFLTPCAALGTALIQISWYLKFFDAGGYDSGPLTLIPMGVSVGFSALFLAAGWLGREKRSDDNTAASIVALAVTAFGFAFLMLAHPAVTARPVLLYGFLFLAQIPVLAISPPRLLHAAASLACSAHLAWWTTANLDSANLPLALVMYLAFGALFAATDRAKSWLAALSGLSTFALFLAAVGNLRMPSTSPIFPAALAMAALLCGLWIAGRHGSLVLAALAGTLLVEAAWHWENFAPWSPAAPLAWYGGVSLAFLVLPFAFRRAAGSQSAPWAAAALAGVGHFLLVKNAVERAFPNDFMGLVPAAFAIPALAALFAVLRIFPEMDAPQRSRAAWFGGVVLLFVTLIFPIQFERQWITVSWAIEGALLIWLFRRVPHPGLRLTGIALLATAFVRLALNPAIIGEYPRGEMAIFNWHLYAFGIVASAQIAGALWLGNVTGKLENFRPRGILFALGGILLFLLLNIEIADWFTPRGNSFIALSFSGNFARDMTYSIAWGSFALALLGIGFATASRHTRYAAVGLLAATLLKLFLHDLATIESVFRIAAFIVVAVIAFAASFLYQRFFDPSGNRNPDRE